MRYSVLPLRGSRCYSLGSSPRGTSWQWSLCNVWHQAARELVWGLKRKRHDPISSSALEEFRILPSTPFKSRNETMILNAWLGKQVHLEKKADAVYWRIWLHRNTVVKWCLGRWRGFPNREGPSCQLGTLLQTWESGHMLCFRGSDAKISFI